MKKIPGSPLSRRPGMTGAFSRQYHPIVMAGHGRSKNGVASLADEPAIPAPTSYA
jgi:hypothetical protein